MVVRAKIHQLKSSLVYKRCIMKILTTCDLLEDNDSVLVIFISSLLISTVLGSLWVLHELHRFKKNSISYASSHNFSSVFLKCFWKLFLELEILSLFIYWKTNGKQMKSKHLPRISIFCHPIPSYNTSRSSYCQ